MNRKEFLKTMFGTAVSGVAAVGLLASCTSTNAKDEPKEARKGKDGCKGKKPRKGKEGAKEKDGNKGKDACKGKDGCGGN